MIWDLAKRYQYLLTLVPHDASTFTSTGTMPTLMLSQKLLGLKIGVLCVKRPKNQNLQRIYSLTTIFGLTYLSLKLNFCVLAFFYIPPLNGERFYEVTKHKVCLKIFCDIFVNGETIIVKRFESSRCLILKGCRTSSQRDLKPNRINRDFKPNILSKSYKL